MQERFVTMQTPSQEMDVTHRAIQKMRSPVVVQDHALIAAETAPWILMALIQSRVMMETKSVAMDAHTVM